MHLHLKSILERGCKLLHSTKTRKLNCTCIRHKSSILHTSQPGSDIKIKSLYSSSLYSSYSNSLYIKILIFNPHIQIHTNSYILAHLKTGIRNYLSSGSFRTEAIIFFSFLLQPAFPAPLFSLKRIRKK